MAASPSSKFARRYLRHRFNSRFYFNCFMLSGIAFLLLSVHRYFYSAILSKELEKGLSLDTTSNSPMEEINSESMLKTLNIREEATLNDPGSFLTFHDQSWVWTKQTENADFNKEVIKLSLWIEKNIPGMHVTNRNGYHGQRNFHKMKNKPVVTTLCRMIANFVEEIMTSFPEGSKNKVKAEIHQSWVNINRGKAKNVWHIHGTEYISVVYYAKTLPGTSILFKEGRNTQSAKIWANTNGKLVAFPSFIYHEVPPTKSQEARISIAFNVKVNILKKSSKIQMKQLPVADAFDPRTYSGGIILGQTILYNDPYQNSANIHLEAKASALMEELFALGECQTETKEGAVPLKMMAFPVRESNKPPPKGPFTLHHCSSSKPELLTLVSDIIAPSMAGLINKLKDARRPDDNFLKTYLTNGLLRARKVETIKFEIAQIEGFSLQLGELLESNVWGMPLRGTMASPVEGYMNSIPLHGIYFLSASSVEDVEDCAFLFEDRRLHLSSWKWITRSSLSDFNTILLPNLYGFGKTILPVKENGRIFIFTNSETKDTLVQQLGRPGMTCKWILFEARLYLPGMND